jgi:mannan endo-1,4-beta-mannosidase
MLIFSLLLTQAQLRATEFSVDLMHSHRINPLVYGINNAANPELPYGCYRYGGNSNTPYNWVNNLSNAGSDYQQSSGLGWPLRFTPKARWNSPAAGIIHHQETANRIGAESIIQVNVIGYAAADGDGAVAPDQVAPSKRWVEVRPRKGAPFTDNPDPKSPIIYTDEMVAYLVKHFGPASSKTGVKWYELDNEPGCWPSTHPRIHPQPVTCQELVQKSIAVASAIKAVDPTAKILGPSSTNFYDANEIGAGSGWDEIKKRGHYAWFMDYYLDEFRKASAKQGIRLLDCLDSHFYVDGSTVTDGGNQGVLQGPRQLWDPTYHEPTWLGEVLGNLLPAIPMMKKSVAKYFPGTMVGMTEWNSQSTPTLIGEIASTDMIGTFGAHGLDLACWWSLQEKEVQDLPGVYSVWKMYLNYDGKGGRFGDLSHPIKNPDPYNYSIYAATDSKSGDLHLILISKRRHLHWQPILRLPKGKYRSAEAFGFGTEAGEILKSYPNVKFEGSTFTADLPKLTAVHVVFRSVSR